MDGPETKWAQKSINNGACISQDRPLLEKDAFLVGRFEWGWVNPIGKID
jgi:hypothetical protein